MRSQLHKSTSVSKTLVSTGVWIIVLIWFPWDSHHMTSIIIMMTMTIKQQLTFYRQWLYNLRSWPNSRSHWIEFTGSLLNRRLSFEIDNDWLTDYSFMKAANQSNQLTSINLNIIHLESSTLFQSFHWQPGSVSGQIIINPLNESLHWRLICWFIDWIDMSDCQITGESVSPVKTSSPTQTEISTPHMSTVEVSKSVVTVSERQLKS